MRFSAFISVLVAAVCVSAQTQWPIHNDNLTSVVEWDHYSYIINGHRLFIWSGEIHYWRIPVPELWIDILQKVKAAGFNTVSFYGNWAFHSAKDGSLDFETGAHNFEKLFEITKQLGLYVLFRPGPYVNAETNAGGFPGWLTTGAYGTLRNNDTRYTKAWTPYFKKMSEIVAKHQVTNGGNVFIYQVENEYGNQWTNVAKKTPNYAAIDYMELLEKAARDSGIDVPLIHNNPNMNTKSWSTDYGAGVGGNVDNYGLDHYPSCWSCNLAECTGTNGNVPEFTVYDYYTNFQQVAPTQPSFLAEFQGGSYNPWGGPEGGCVNNTGPDWVNVYYRHNIAQKVSAMNVYMLFGGTNCIYIGGLPMPQVGTSYDYSAPISESRTIGDKYHETKLFAQFLRVARDLTKVDKISNGTTFASDPKIYTTELRNADTNAGFYVTIHTSSPSTELTPFKLNVSTSLGNLTIPQYTPSIILNGRQSKIIVTDFSLEHKKSKLIYSTAEVLTLSTQDSMPLLFLWLPSSESGEFYLSSTKLASVLKKDGCSNLNIKERSNGLIISYTQLSGTCVLKFDNGIRAVLTDRRTAYTTWFPTISTDPFTPENSTIIVQGPYLVRTAEAKRDVLQLTGDWTSTASLEIYAPEKISSVIFNGKNVNVRKTKYGSLIGTIGSSVNTIESIKASLQALTGWQVADGLPERKPEYDDSRWVLANKSTTQNPTKPATYPVLYADDYGFHSNILLYRARFPTPSNSTLTGVTLSVIAGTSSGWSAYLNGNFIGSHLGSTSITNSTLTLSFSNTTLYSPANSTAENVLFVIVDNMGHDQTSGATNPRGIWKAILNTALGDKVAFTSWRIAGTAGGESNIDPVRGPLNEGGLHGERLGWHLPSYSPSTHATDLWTSAELSQGLSQAGVNFYRKDIELDVPEGVDISLGFRIGSPAGSKIRALIWVNGWQFGKYVPWIGNQVSFPVFPGILNYHGPNTIAVSLWTQDALGGSLSLDWEVLGVVESAFDPGFKGEDMGYLYKDGGVDRGIYY